MPKPQAAVPFVNQKGQRSMKRVKVERYRPGKVPAYAAGAQDEDEYYTTDDEYEDEEDADDRDQDVNLGYEHQSIDRDVAAVDDKARSSFRQVVEKRDIDDDKNVISGSSDSYDDDDPRMRKLKLLSKKGQIVRARHKTTAKQHHSSEDETEEQVKLRHQLARNRIQDPPIGLKTIFPEFNESTHMVSVKHEDDSDDDYLSQYQQQAQQQRRIIDTDDIMGDFMPTGLRPEDMKRKENDEMQESFMDLLEEAKEEAILRSNLERQVEDDIKLEKLREARARGDFSASNKANSVNTDDESESDGPEYQAWKKREISRILRYERELAKVMASIRL